MLAVTLIKGERPDDLELVEHWQGKEIEVSSTPPQTTQCDGELLNDATLRVAVVPGAVTVLVPHRLGA